MHICNMNKILPSVAEHKSNPHNHSPDQRPSKAVRDKTLARQCTHDGKLFYVLAVRRRVIMDTIRVRQVSRQRHTKYLRKKSEANENIAIIFHIVMCYGYRKLTNENSTTNGCLVVCLKIKIKIKEH